jgi:hypothetical protein
VILDLDHDLEATGGPPIVGFEFAGSAEQAAKIMAEWGAHGRDLARRSLWIDYGLILSYGSFLALAAIMIRDFAREREMRLLALAGIVAPLFAVSAALFDATENVFLLLVLGGHGGKVAPPLAAACASIKFLQIGLAIAYAVWGLASWIVRRRG